NEFGPVTRIQRKVQPQPPAPPARTMGEIGEIDRPNVLLRCDGYGYLFFEFVVTLPNIQSGFSFSAQDPTPLYTGGQEIVIAEVTGGHRLKVRPSAGNTIDGSTAAVHFRPHQSRTFASDGEYNWITIATNCRCTFPWFWLGPLKERF